MKFFSIISSGLLILFAAGLLFSYRSVLAADFVFYPGTAALSAGQQFSVGVYVSSSDRSVNAASGTMRFDADKLEVASLSKTGSIFSLWVKEPVFSNAAGTVNFEGIVLNPGFTGQSGKILEIVFKAKSAGAAGVTFAAASVLANDGKGTNILGTIGKGSYTIVTSQSASVVASVVSVAESRIDAAKISSVTHPDQEQWYSGKDAIFVWENSTAVNAVRLLIAKEKAASASVVYTPPISEKKINDLEDGTWYFHLQQKFGDDWSRTGYYKVNIDGEPPLPFAITTKTAASGQPVLFFEAEDVLSGIDRYEIIIDGKDPAITRKTSLQLNSLKSGRHNISIAAFDNAGNNTKVDTDVDVSVKKPKVISYRSQLEEGAPFWLKGSAAANASVSIFIQDQNGGITSDKVISNSDGFWNYSGIPLEAGIYQVWAVSADGYGALSEGAEKITIRVNELPIAANKDVAAGYMFAIGVYIALSAVAVCAFFLVKDQKKAKKIRISEEINEAEKASHVAFSLLKKEVEEQIAGIDRSPKLSQREKQIADKLKEALETADGFVAKEIEDIKNEADKK